MKRNLIGLLALVVCGAAMATQDTDITPRELRDPKQLETWLEANASDAESRLTTAGAVATSAIVLTNSSNAGTASITANVDKNDDAGDLVKLLVADGGALSYQTDVSSKGTLATKLTIGNSGIVTLAGSATIDNSTSASELNLSETTVKVTGAFSVTGDATISGGDVTGAHTNAIDIGEVADGSFTFGRATAGAVTLTAVDSDANADITLVPGGTGVLTLGDVTDSTVRIPLMAVVTDATTNRVVTSADYGKMILLTSNSVCTITLPANGTAAGAWFEIAPANRSATVKVSDGCAPVISAATADTLIGPNDVDLKSVTWGTGQRIGAKARFWSDGFFWHVDNLGGTTMTYND
jgi:hypothetical protein